jgi:outer membrane receptor protein involved in Fe transport
MKLSRIMLRLALPVFVLHPIAGLAQSEGAAAVAGVAADTTGAVVANAVADLFGPVRRITRSSTDGRFLFEQLPAGEYRLLVSHPGFATQDLRFILAPAERRDVAVTLPVAGVAEFVETVSRVREEALRTPFLASQVTSEELRRAGAVTFEEALRAVPGLQHGTQGNAFTRISTRGLRDTADVLVMLDGVPFRQLNGSADLTMLPVPAMQGIEFIKGPASSMYGRSAIGGVMQVFTVPERSARTTGEVRLGYSSFDTREGNAHAQLPWGSGRLASVVALSSTDGFQTGAGRHARFGSITAEQTVASRAQLRFQYLFSDVDAGRGSIVPLQAGEPLFGITREDNFGIPGARFEGTLHSATQRTDVDLGRGVLASNALNFNRYDRFSTSGITIVPPPTASNKAWSESTARQDTLIDDFTLRWDTGTAAVRSQFLAGFTAEHGTQDQLAPTFTGAPTYLGPDYRNPVPGPTASNDPRGIRGATTTSAFEQTIVSVYMQERLERGRIGGIVGLRWDSFEQSLRRSDTVVVSADSRSRVSPRVGLDVVVAERNDAELVTFVNWVEGFRPQFPALSTQAGVTVPQLLRPEVTRSVEGGAKIRRGALSAQVGVFTMRKLDGQRSFRTGPDDFLFVNATTRVRGTEMDARLRLPGAHAVWGHYAFHDARHVEFRPTPTSSFDGFRLRMAPRHVAGAGATILVGEVAWTTSLSYVGSRPLRDNVLNPQMLSPYTTVDMSGSLDVGRVRFVVFGSNLTDTFYIADDFSSQNAGNPGPPRRVGVQVGYRF